MEDARQRRIHRACGPCRRKKVKCPGERPVCSFCQRLGQPCEYKSEYDPILEAQNSNMNNRMDALETKLDQVLYSLSNIQSNPSPVGVFSAPPIQRQPEDFMEAEQSIQVQTEESEPSPSEEDRLPIVGALYLTWCHSQPLHLFKVDGFIDTLKSRDRELRLAIQLLTCRFPPGPITRQTQDTVSALVKSCRSLVTERIANGRIKLSTLQCLCILSLACFADGSQLQAGLDLETARYFTSHLPSGSSLGDPIEYSLCVQAISLLNSMQGPVPDLSKAARGESYLQKEVSNLQPDKIPPPGEPRVEGDFYRGIIPHMAQAAEVWHMARAYAVTRVAPDSPPPWSPQSDYSLIMLRHLELDCLLPVRYRFATSKFQEMTLEMLHERRDYWIPWLITHFMHATIPTLVNHPFLLSFRLKNFRHMMPSGFLYQSFDHISRHTAWVMCFLDMLEKKRFQVTDPTIAHCVAIVATIHLQHSFVEDYSLRKKAQQGYDMCMGFLDRAGSTWLIVREITKNLRRLRESVKDIPSASSHRNGSGTAHQSLSIDANLLWDILVYEKAGPPQDRSLFEDIITTEDENQQDVSEFATVGTAGLTGHRTFRPEHPAYAPQDRDPYKSLNPLATQSGTGEEPGTQATDGFESLGDLNMMNMIDQGNFLLQAGDFGRAVNDWINFDMTDIS